MGEKLSPTDYELKITSDGQWAKKIRLTDCELKITSDGLSTGNYFDFAGGNAR